MWKITKTQFNKLIQTRFMQQTMIVCRTFWIIVTILGLAALSAYLLITSKDTVVTVIGVAVGVFGLSQLVSAAYRAARFQTLATRAAKRKK